MKTTERIKLIARSEINDLLNRMENSAKLRQLDVHEIRQNIQRMRSLIVDTVADQKQLEKSIDENLATAKKWEDRATFALEKNEDQLARRAIERKLDHEQKADRHRDQLSDLADLISKLKGDLELLDQKLDQLRFGVPITKPKSDPSAFKAYDEIADRVSQLADHIEAFSELDDEARLESEFRRLEIDERVERDLAKLKERLKK